MSNSVQPHRRQPTSLPHPWDSPGKSTEVGCHFRLQSMKVKSESEVTQLYLTLSIPMDCSPPGSSVHGIFQARVLEWGAIAFSVPLMKSPQTQVHNSLSDILSLSQKYWFWTCSLQNQKTIHVCCSKPPSVWLFVTVATGNSWRVLGRKDSFKEEYPLGDREETEPGSLWEWSHLCSMCSLPLWAHL